MPIKKGRIIIDTNLWISFLLTANISKLDKFFSDESIVLLFSEELLEEFIEVAGRPKFKKYFSLRMLENLLGQIRLRAEFINVTTVINLCRDPKDNFLLSLAKDGHADFLITGDNDLLVLKKLDKTKILTLTEYLSR
jgi:putative PIN family toxin of toxin-antitoxin system